MDAETSVEGTVSGVNLTQWSQESIKKTTDYPQELDGYWNVEGNVTFNGDVASTGVLKDMNIREMAEQLQRKRNNKSLMQKKIAVRNKK